VNVWTWATVAVLIVLLLACAGALAPLDAAFHLVAGWLFFLSRVGPQLTLSGPGVVTAVVSLALFVAGFQWLATWWTAAVPAIGEEPTPERTWQWRWTFIATSAVVLSFVAGVAVVGATHQLVWMATSPEPLVKNTSIEFRRTQSRHNLKQIGLALHLYHDEHARLPAGGTFDRLGRPLLSWQTSILPYIDEAALFGRIHLDRPWDAPENAAALSTIVQAYQIPVMGPEVRSDASGRGLSHYAGNARVLGGGPGLPLSAFDDGTSTTFIAGEVNASFRPWGDPVNWRDAALGINRSPEGFGSLWSGGMHLLLADGSVRFVSENIDQQVLDALATPDGGETVGEF
jgi:hypothetical protein